MNDLTNRDFYPSVWVVVAAMASDAVAVAAYVAFVKVYEKKDDSFSYEAAGVINLEQFQGTQLFRLVVRKEDGSVLTCLNFSTDTHFKVKMRKVQGGTSGVLGVEVSIEFEYGFSEGYEKLVLRMPYDGKAGSAVLIGMGCEHAATVVARGIEKLQQIEAAQVAAAIQATAPTTPAVTGPTTNAPGSGSSCVFSPMSIG